MNINLRYRSKEVAMALFDDLPKGPVPVLVGLGVAVAVPTVIPAVASGLRPLVKMMVKTTLTLFDAVKGGISEAGEEVNDIVSESRTEMSRGARRVMTNADDDRMTTGKRPHHRRYRA
jgi:Protein of unknown function (DUF5132)